MQNIADQVLGGTLTHTEYNSHKNSNQNAITSTGQTLSGGDAQQLGKAMAGYAAISDYYTESGAADAYVLTPIGSFNSPYAYTDGMLIRFRAGNANTGASTVNVNSLGVKNLKKADGTTNLDAGDIPTDKDAWFRYDNANGAFALVEFASGGVSTLAALTKAINQASHGFAVGDVLKVSGGAYAKAQSDSIANCEGVAGVVSAVADTSNFTIQFSGYISGLSGLTANTLHYLDASTAGAITTTEPTISKPVIIADTTSSGWILPQKPTDTGASSGDLVKISTATASASATIDFTGLDSTYEYYMVEFNGVIPATGSQQFRFRVGTGGGPTYDTGNNYDYVASVRDAGGPSGASAQAEAFIRLSGSLFGNAAGEIASGNLRIHNPSDATENKLVDYQLGHKNGSGQITVAHGVGQYESDTAVTAIRFYFASGNISSGNFTLYGIK